jgi:hypothetical protein
VLRPKREKKTQIRPFIRPSSLSAFSPRLLADKHAHLQPSRRRKDVVTSRRRRPPQPNSGHPLLTAHKHGFVGEPSMDGETKIHRAKACCHPFEKKKMSQYY